MSLYNDRAKGEGRDGPSPMGRHRDQVLALVPLMGSLTRTRNYFKNFITVVKKNQCNIFFLLAVH